MRTGTATYLDTVLRRVAGAAAASRRLVIATDPSLLPEGLAATSSLYGFPVVGYDELPKEPDVGVTRIYFLANNDHHAFVHESLRRSEGRARGRKIAVIHDPSMFMVHRHMHTMSRHVISTTELVEVNRAQFGAMSERLVAARLRGDLPEVFEHGAHCLGPTLECMHEVWVHSLYAANRIIFETDIPAERLPIVRVCSHPHGDESQSAAPQRNIDTFVIGMFGWVTPPKRPLSILRGLDLALSRLSRDDQRRIKLLVVGRVPKGTPEDPVAEVQRLGLSDHATFIDYPDQSTFEGLIASCDLIFNLRYPSCGESSGTLATAEANGAKVVVSRYQSFREAQGAWRAINVAQPFETWEIAQAILDAFHQPEASTEQRKREGLAPVEKLLLAEMLMDHSR